eukprot:TRINITY_DN86879_c0_g1_i1.p1 TRINITY_DN86879_c0_g1~~TRINITY_DN86879_c0_g1_i1.p1  ORF type:complete len:238 (-),score=34.35 TRINITY_DN86879_c0_g1_i1:74-787(-)
METPLVLHYLPVRARAEPLRMMLKHANIPHTYKEISFADWPAVKPTMPTGVVPVLEFPDGKRMPETADIAKYIAQQAGDPLWSPDAERIFALLDATDAPWCSSAIPTLNRINPLLNWFPQEEADPQIGKFLSEVPGIYEHIASMIKTGPFIGGSAPHYGDFAMFHFTDNVCTLDGGNALQALGGHTATTMQNWFRAMHSLPAVRSLLSERSEPGTGEVGREGSIIAKHEVPWSRFEQ